MKEHYVLREKPLKKQFVAGKGFPVPLSSLTLVVPLEWSSPARRDTADLMNNRPKAPLQT
jgi:hypothetical protein